ncbi:hypothetical protein DM02DRAFT_654160 [Periconia macrospinosa]|uniref:Uncharacterized protein n=1 Tax=Periconia macrospinosa TaxID=97972 RepID=A0A2V1DY57_9PLEO|nr:hypothetical protein DM02DRAFT_654160 [Periconia macrospinosa]
MNKPKEAKGKPKGPNSKSKDDKEELQQADILSTLDAMASGTPYIIMYGRRVHECLSSKSQMHILRQISKEERHQNGLKIFHHPVSFRDWLDTCSYCIATGDEEDKYKKCTILDLLEKVRYNGTRGKGTVFSFSEMPCWTGNWKRDHAKKPAGHDWAGMLIKRATDDEQWCLNIYCIGTDPIASPKRFMRAWGGRWKLWLALRTVFHVTEVNISNSIFIDQVDSCVMNSLMWIHQVVTTCDGSPWKTEKEERLRLLGLRQLAAGADLHEQIAPSR